MTDTTIKEGMVLYAGYEEDDARKYISDNGYTADDVKMVKSGDQVLVKARRAIEATSTDKNIRVIDFETTGMPDDENPHSIIEAAFVDVDTGEFWESLVKPTTEMDIRALAIHHITEDKANKNGLDWDAAKKILDGADIYAAHNAEFEQKFYNPQGSVWICTYKVALKLWPDAPSHSNQVLKYYLEIADKQAHHPPHRALPDCFVTAEIIKKMLELTTIEEMIEITNQPPYLTKINFGKHYGKKFSELPRDYLEWIIKQDMDEGVTAAANRELAA